MTAASLEAARLFISGGFFLSGDIMKRSILGVCLALSAAPVLATPAVSAIAKVSCTSANERLLAVILGAPGDGVAAFTLTGDALVRASDVVPGMRVYELSARHLWDCAGTGGCRAVGGQLRLDGPVSGTLGAVFSGRLVFPGKGGFEFVAHVEEQDPACPPEQQAGRFVSKAEWTR